MDVGAIQKLLEALGVRETTVNGGWVMSTCPLAPWTHKGGKDSNPSFGVKVEPQDKSYFNCFACHSGSLFSLVQTIAYNLSVSPVVGRTYDLRAALEILDGGDVVVLPDYDSVRGDAVVCPWPDTALDEMGLKPLVEGSTALKYLDSRGVDLGLADSMGVREDFLRQRVVFPIRNAYGQLCGARGRSYDYSCPPQFIHYDYTFDGVNNTNLVWFNEKALNEDLPVIVVEGQFDVCRVLKVYPAVVGILTAKASAKKLSKLAQTSGVLFMLDNDDTGRLSTEKMLERVSGMGVPCGVVSYPEKYKDPDSVPDEEMREILSSLL